MAFGKLKVDKLEASSGLIVDVDKVAKKTSERDGLNIFVAKMAAGEAVNICAFGDSTTDGNGTSPLTLNTIGTDHNLDAPNAWPAKLQEILREAYSNQLINVWNAGFSGQRIEDQWAYDNYQAAVIDNPFYGVPDVVFIGFGLNDITTLDTLDDHITETRRLMDRILSDGSLPVLVTCDPSRRNGVNNVRDNKEAERQLNAAKVSLAAEYGTPLIDTNEPMKRWISDNEEGYKWLQLQSDGLHFNNKGHAFKAQVFFKALFHDMLIYQGGSQFVSSWDSKANMSLEYDNDYLLVNNRQGGNIYQPSSVPSESDLMTLYIWNDKTNSHLIYNGLGNEGYDDPLTYTVEPKIVVSNFTEETEDEYLIPSVGITQSRSPYRSADETYVLKRLPYGLTKVVYKSGDLGAAYFGYFSVASSDIAIPSNALKNSGKVSYKFSQNTGELIREAPAASDLSNVAGYLTGQVLSIVMDIECSRFGGVLLLSGKSFGRATSLSDNEKYAIMAYRNSGDNFMIYGVAYNDSGVISTTLLGQNDTPGFWSTDRIKVRYEQENLQDGTVEHRFYDAEFGGTLIMSLSVDKDSTYAPRYTGIVGGAYANTDIATGDVSITIHESVILRD